MYFTITNEEVLLPSEVYYMILWYINFNFRGVYNIHLWYKQNVFREMYYLIKKKDKNSFLGKFIGICPT